MRQKVMGFFILFFWTSSLLAAEVMVLDSNVAAKTSLGSFIDEALKNNPRLKAYHDRVLAAKARVAFLRDIPDPMLEYEYDRITPAGGMADGEKIRPMKSLSVSQGIPFPTKVFMRRQLAQKEVNALEQEYKKTEQELIKDVKSSYFNLFLNLRKVSLVKNSLSLMGQIVEVVNKKYSVNKAGQSDVFRAQIEYSKLSNTLVLYEKEIAISRSLLSSLLGREDEALFEVSDDDLVKGIDFKEQDIVELARNSQPELKAVKERLGKAVVENSLAKQGLLPDITLKYKREEKDGSFRDGEWAGMIGVNVPLWFWGKQLAEIREARASAEAAKEDYKSAENMAVFEAKSAWAQYEASRRFLDNYETGILPRAASLVAVAQKSFETGGVSFLEVLDALRMQRDLQMEYAEALAGLQISLAELERAVGCDLQKQGGR